MTTVSEDAISQQPWFVHNTSRAPWACVSPSGHPYPQFKSISTKGDVAFWSVHTDSYGLRLLAAVEGLFHPERVYFAGVFDSGSKNSSLNINTNTIMLEAILYYRLGRSSPSSRFTLGSRQRNP
ncbi:MAG TPA: DUF3131 domain-containing protein [Candidatus Angelobacter sp.]|nr:DUF3131 domain-containing protein [Candidatus Angelobacter sp.]